MSDEKTTQAALIVLQQQEAAKRTVNIGQAVADLKANNFFKYSWDDMLYAAPNCLELLGTCTSVAASDAASGIVLTLPPSGKFKFLTARTLKGTLAEISNQGQTAFQEADRGMAQISTHCMDVRTSVTRILAVLSAPDAPAASLIGHLDDLKEYSTKCHDQSKTILAAFDQWQNLTKELWASCTEETALVEKRQKDLEAKLAFAESTKESGEALAAEQKDRVEKMEKTMLELKKDYKSAMKDFPGAWTLLGQQVAMGLTEAVGAAAVVATSVATQSAAMTNPAYAATQLGAAASKFGSAQPVNVIVAGSSASTTPSAVANTAAPASTGALAGGQESMVLDSELAKEAGQKKEGALAKLRSVFSASKIFGKKNVDSKAADSGKVVEEKPLSGTFYPHDPALIIAPVILGFAESIERLVSVDGSRWVDWDKIVQPKKEEGEKRPTNSEGRTIFLTLERKSKDFSGDKDGLASQLMTKVIAESAAIISEMVTEAEKALSLGEWKKPDNDGELVKSWEERIIVCVSTLRQIKQIGDSAAGRPAPANLLPPRSQAEIAASQNVKTSLAEQTVRSATAKLTSAQQAYQGTLDTYTAFVKTQNDLKKDLASAKAEVAGLELQALTHENVRKVLIQCIGFLGQLKYKIAKFADFFSHVAIFVDSIMSSQVKPFERELKILRDENPESPSMVIRYNAYMRDIIFQLVLQIYSSFALFRDVAGMYSDVHRLCIAPGMQLVDELGISSEKDVSKMTSTEKAAYDKNLKEKKKRLSDYAVAAEKRVHEIVQAKQQEILGSLEKKVKSIGDQIAQFPAALGPSESQRKAITDGQAVAQASIDSDIASEPSAMPLATGGTTFEGGLD